MAPTPRVESFDEMGAQRHKPVYAPRWKIKNKSLKPISEIVYAPSWGARLLIKCLSKV